MILLSIRTTGSKKRQRKTLSLFYALYNHHSANSTLYRAGCQTTHDILREDQVDHDNREDGKCYGRIDLTQIIVRIVGITQLRDQYGKGLLFNDPAPTESYTLSLPAALPISHQAREYAAFPDFPLLRQYKEASSASLKGTSGQGVRCFFRISRPGLQAVLRFREFRDHLVEGLFTHRVAGNFIAEIDPAAVLRSGGPVRQIGTVGIAGPHEIGPVGADDVRKPHVVLSPRPCRGDVPGCIPAQ